MSAGSGFLNSLYKEELIFEKNLKNPAVAGYIIATVTKLYTPMFEEAEQLIKQADVLKRSI